MRLRQLLTLALAVTVAGGMAFASGQKEGQSGSQGQSQPTELHVFQFKPALDEAYNDLAADFESQYDGNVNVTIETKGGGTQWQTILKSRFAAGEGPDIFPVEGPGQYRTWQDQIADLSGEPWIEKANQAALQNLRIDGNQYGMPVNVEGYGYIYNKDIFEEVGIEEIPSTLNELRSAAQRIQDAGYTPFATGYGTWWVISLHLANIPFAHQENPDRFIQRLNDGEQLIADNQLFQDWQNLVDLTVEYGEENPLTTDHNQQVQLFANGEVAMIQQGVWKEIAITEANPDVNMGVVPMPLNNSAQMDRIPVGVPFYFAVNATSPEPEQQAARDFLNFLVNSETGQQYVTERFQMIPAYTHMSGEALGGVGQGILDYSAQEKTIPWQFGQFPDGFTDDVTNAVQAYIAGQHDWQTVLETMDEAWQDRAGN